MRDVAEGIFDGPHATPRKVESGPYFLSISSLQAGRLDLTASARISEVDYPRWTRRVTPAAGDLVFSYETRIGEAALIPPGLRCCLGRRMALVRPDRGRVIPEFLLYQFLGPEFQEVLRSRTVPGSTVPRILLTEFPDFPVQITPLQEQERIVWILSALDDKIDLNREMNRTLEAMAQAIFRSWFVDFDPVVAKSEGREPFGMDAETAALFPDQFVESELGPIPDEWEVVPTASLARYVNGRAFTKNASGTGRMVIRIAELNSGPGASTIYNDLPDLPIDHVAQPGDILFAWSGSLGVYRWTLPEAIINQHIFKVIPDGVPDWFVYCHLSGVMPVYRAIAAGKATTMGHIKRSHLSETTAIRPRTPELLARADAIMRPIRDLWLNNERESQTLASLRDLLLPKLLSGEIRVPEAAEMVEDVA